VLEFDRITTAKLEGKMEAKNIQRVLVIGPGTMGTQIAFQCALFDCQVKIYGRDIHSLERGHKRLTKLSNLLVKGKYITKEQALGALTRIQMTSDKLMACEGTQLITESVPERIELKRWVWNQFGKIVSNNTILTTNSSTFLPSQLAEYSRHPENFLAWHFHLFCYINKIVDIMPHSETKSECVDTILAFSSRIKQTPIILHKEHQGYVFNAMLCGFLAEAMRLAINHVASIEDIDRAWMRVMNTPQGPFGIINSIGFDNIYNIIEAARDKDPQNESYGLALHWLRTEFDNSSYRKKSNRRCGHKNINVENIPIPEEFHLEPRLRAVA
jgi:3-hydroxybutyryl-CoA dehydrogenase